MNFTVLTMHDTPMLFYIEQAALVVTVSACYKGNIFFFFVKFLRLLYVSDLISGQNLKVNIQWLTKLGLLVYINNSSPSCCVELRKMWRNHCQLRYYFTQTVIGDTCKICTSIFKGRQLFISFFSSSAILFLSVFAW